MSLLCCSFTAWAPSREKLLRAGLPAEEHDVPVDLVLTERQSLSSFRGKKSGA